MSTTTGTGTLTLGSASSSYQTFAAAGLTNLSIVSYLITEATAWEVGIGTYTSSGTTLSRTLVQSSTGSLLNLGGAETVEVIASAADFTGFSPERRIVPPRVADFTLENAGTASMADNPHGITLTVPSATSNIRFIRYNAGPPSTPYSVVVRMQSVDGAVNLTTAYSLCLIFRNSGSSKVLIAGTYSNGLLAQSWSSYTAFNANLSAVPVAVNPSLTNYPWFKAVNDGTNVSWFFSIDGDVWYPTAWATTALVTYIASVDQIGFGIFTGAPGVTVTNAFQSFEVLV